MLGLLGPNGAGETTAVRVLATLLRADAGRVEVAGVDGLADPGAVRSMSSPRSTTAELLRELRDCGGQRGDDAVGCLVLQLDQLHEVAAALNLLFWPSDTRHRDRVVRGGSRFAVIWRVR